MRDIDTIRPLIADDDFQTLVTLRNEILGAFEHGQVFRTRTEMEVSVLNDVKRPTPDAKYWQAVREQRVMFSELINLSYEYRKVKVELAKAQRSLDNWEGDDLDRELVQIEADRLIWTIKQQERVAHDRIRELREWADIKAKLLPEMTCGTEDPGEHQLVSYGIGWLREIQAGGLETGSQPERINLMAKADAVLKLAAEKGVLDKVLKDFAPKFVRGLSKSGIGGEAWQQYTLESQKTKPERA